MSKCFFFIELDWWEPRRAVLNPYDNLIRQLTCHFYSTQSLCRASSTVADQGYLPPQALLAFSALFIHKKKKLYKLHVPKFPKLARLKSDVSTNSQPV